ncbi:MAG: hypothetical protein Q8N84_03235 [bacterium]|nr:hypothetical protein [bacterium]
MRVYLSFLLSGLVLAVWLAFVRAPVLAQVLCQGTGACTALGSDPLVDPNGKIVSILYEFQDYNNVNWRLFRPGWGAVGSWFYAGWGGLQSSAEDGSFSLFADYLNQICTDRSCTVSYEGKQIHKPVALSILLTNQGSDETPGWVYTSGGAQRYSLPSKTAGCPAINVPAWGDPKWQEAYASMILKFGQAFKDNPLVDSIWIASGNYGESAVTVTIGGCKYDLNTNGLFGNWLKQGWVDASGRRRSVQDLYRTAFGPDKPIFMLITGGALSRELSDTACDFNVGYKTNTLVATTNMAYSCNGGGGGVVQIADRLKDRCPIGYEHAFGDNPHGAYWALMSSLAHGVDLLDLEALESAGYSQFFETISKVKMPTGEPLWDFWQRHVGYGFRSGEKAPEDAWIMFRDAEPGQACKAEDWENQESGDWEFYLYRPENTCRGLPAGTCEAGTDMGNRFNVDVSGGITEYVLPSAVGGTDQVYGAWGARKTTNNGSMFFRLDDRWAKKTDTAFDIMVTYWADGGTFGLNYYDALGNLQEKPVTKSGSGWKTATISISNADLTKTLITGGNNFALTSGGDGDDIFHLVIVRPKGSSPPPTLTCPQYAAGRNSFSPTACTSFPSLKASDFTVGDRLAVSQSANGGWWTTYVASYSQAGGMSDFSVAGGGPFAFSCLRKSSQ